MSARELRQLIADNDAWLRRPENQGQAITVHRLRSQQRDQERPSTSDGHQTDSNAVTERRGGRARDLPRRRGQEERRERSRSPLRPDPAEPSTSTGESSRRDGHQASGSASATEFEFHRPNPMPPSPGPIDFPSTSRYSVYSSPAERHFHMVLGRQGMMTPPLPQVEPSVQHLPVQVRQRIWARGRARQIANLPTRDVTPQEEAQSCVICMTEYEIGERVTVLPCNHSFHQDCISAWLSSNPVCPLCRDYCFR